MQPSIDRRCKQREGTPIRVAVPQLNAEQFPKSGNAWDSLAEAYARNGQDEIAEIYYAKSLEVEPRNEHALEALRDLRVAAGMKLGGE